MNNSDSRALSRVVEARARRRDHRRRADARPSCRWRLAASLGERLPQQNARHMKPDRASIARLDLVLHLGRKDGCVAAVTDAPRAEARKRDPAGIMWQDAGSQLLADRALRVRPRWHAPSRYGSASTLGADNWRTKSGQP